MKQRRWRGLAASAGLLAVSLCVTLLLLEAVLRAIPAALPSGTYSMGQRFDAAVQSPVYSERVIYNKVRRTLRVPNQLGFLDVEHAESKPPGVIRVGFFGDSYVEAVQVDLEQTFYRLLARAADPRRQEFLAFGISGWGTLHGLLAHRALASRFALDTSVYVFVENDPGDNAWSIMRERPPSYLRRPFAELAGEAPGFRLRWVEGRQARPLARLLRSVYDRSLLARVVWARLALLRGYGPALQRRPEDAEMSASASGAPDQNDLPSSWPSAYVEQARELGRRILARWTQEAGAEGRGFLVLYVPRGEAQLRGEIADADTWKPWLEATCAQLGIRLVDPSPELRAALAEGQAVYDDHWTPAGHAAIAAALERTLSGLRPEPLQGAAAALPYPGAPPSAGRWGG